MRSFRKKSTAEPTKKAAENTNCVLLHLAAERPNTLRFPEVSSTPEIHSDRLHVEARHLPATRYFLIPSPSLYLFGVLSSAMHMAWVRQVCGRLKSDFRYSGRMVYNTYPWPEAPSEKQRTTVEAAAQAVLDVREEYQEEAIHSPICTIRWPCRRSS